MAQSPRQVSTASALMMSVLPAGLIVTVLNLLAVNQTYAALRRTRLRTNLFNIDEALRRFPEFGRDRTAAIAIFFGAAALIFAGFAWLVRRRGAWRRPVVILVPTSVFTAAYAVGLHQTFNRNPVLIHDYGYAPFDSGAAAIIPVNLADEIPDWYLPGLGATLVLAALAQFAALVLLIRAGRHWRVAPAITWATARAVLLLLLAPAFAAIYAALNYLAIESARAFAGQDPFLPRVAGQMWDHAKLLAVILGIASAIMIAALLWAWQSGRPGGATLAGVLCVPYSLCLYVAWWLRPLHWGFFADDQSGLTAARPAWHTPSLALLMVAAVLTVGTSLVLLTRRSSRGPR